MSKIEYTPQVLFHTLTHFETLSGDGIKELEASGFTLAQIEAQIAVVGSKFYSSFATSIVDAVEVLERSFPATFEDAVWDGDGRCRLSFSFDYDIGVCSVVEERVLNEQERLSIREEIRGGCRARVATSQRCFPTSECQLILCGSAERASVCTIFPGILAPPLPKIGGRLDPFWAKHLFVEM